MWYLYTVPHVNDALGVTHTPVVIANIVTVFSVRQNKQLNVEYIIQHSRIR
jgi:hypothetical protein